MSTENGQPSQPEEATRHGPIFRIVQIGSLMLVAGLLGLLIWRVVTVGHGARLVGQIKADEKPPAPRFNLPVLWAHSETWPASLAAALSDDHISPTELRGRPVVLNFFASWCIPCRHEAPRLAASARQHTGRVAFLGIDVQDFRTDARRFLRRYHANYVAVRDTNGSTYVDYGLTGVPETYWIDARGRIIAHYPGEISRRLLEQGIRASTSSR